MTTVVLVRHGLNFFAWYRLILAGALAYFFW